MKLIAQKEGLSNRSTFFQNSEERHFIDGIFLDITITSNGDVVIFSPINSNYQTVGTIQNNPLDQIQSQTIILLDDVLHELKGFTKKIVLNLLPFDSLKITDLNAQKIAKFYEQYVSAVLIVIAKHPLLDLHLCSQAQAVLFQLTKENRSFKIGMVFKLINLNYWDVDFYVFDIPTMNDVLIEELLKRNKIVMISLNECGQINQVMEHIKKSSNPTLLEKELYLICSEPLLVQDLLKDQLG